MARIPEFNETAELHPNDMGMEVAAQAGRRIGAFYHQIGEDAGGLVKQLGDQYQQNVAMQEISRVQKDAATVHSGLLNAWDTASAQADPNDTTVADKFRPAMEDQIEQLGQGVSTKEGKEYVLRQQGVIRDSVTTHVQAGMMERAANAAHLNFEQTNNTNQSTAIDHPEQLGFLAQQTDDNTEALIKAHALPPEQAAVLRDEALKSKGMLLKAAAMGTAMRNPMGAPTAVGSLLEDPKYASLATATEKEQLYGFAKEAQRGAEADARNAAAAQHKQDLDDAEKSAIQAESMYHVDPATGKWFADPGAGAAVTAYSQKPGAVPGRFAELQGYAEKVAKGALDGTDDPATEQSIWNATDPVEKVKAIAAAELSGKLTHKTAEILRTTARTDREQTDPEYKINYEAMKNFVTSIRPSIVQASDFAGNAKDPNEAARYGQFQNDTLALWNREVVQGSTKPADFYAKYLDRNSNTYLGRYVSSYQTSPGTMEQQLQGKVDRMQSGAPRPVTFTPQQVASATAQANAILHGAKPAPAAPAKPSAPPASPHGRDY